MAENQKIPTRCPACGEALVVEALRCPACQTAVEGHYELARFMLLEPDQLQFCELFLKSRGSLKEIGNRLGISYPTARNRLDDLLIALGYEEKNGQTNHIEILQRLEKGDITHAEALRLINGDEEDE